MQTALKTGKDVQTGRILVKTKETQSGRGTGESFFSGVLVLTIAGLLVKAMGMFFKIPMNYIVGDTGMGYYNAAYTIYTFFYMLSTAGLPTAVSILVSSARAEGRRNQSRRILQMALWLFCGIGILGSGVMFVFADELAAWIGAPPSAYSILAAAPTLFFICIASALRGYFQGCSRMVPTAVSQFLEAFCKVGAGILGALYGIRMGEDAPMVAARAVFGLTLGSAVSMLYLILAGLYSHQSSSCRPSDFTEKPSIDSRRTILAGLASIALPITVSSAVMSLTGMIDAVLIQRLLQQSGMTQEAATTLYGNYTSLAVPMFNLPPVLVYPIAYAMVPLLTRYRTERDSEKRAQGLIGSALRMAVLIGAPCALGMSVLSGEILTLLYRSASAETAAPLLTLLAPSSLLVCILAVTNSALQSIGKAGLPVLSMLAGAFIKILTTLWLIPGMGITAAPVSTFFCYLTVTAMNLAFLLQSSGLRPDMGRTFFRPMTAAGVCAMSALAAQRFLQYVLPEKLSVLPAIGIAAVVYCLLIRSMGVLTEEDIALLPGSARLRRWLGLQDKTEKILEK